ISAEDPCWLPDGADFPHSLVHREADTDGVIEAQEGRLHERQLQALEGSPRDLRLKSNTQTPYIPRDDIDIDAGVVRAFDRHDHHRRKHGWASYLCARVLTSQCRVIVARTHRRTAHERALDGRYVQLVQPQWKRLIG